MAAAVAKAIPDVIGVVGSVLTIAGFFGGNVAAPKPEGATVMIKSGLPDLKSEEDSLVSCPLDLRSGQCADIICFRVALSTRSMCSSKSSWSNFATVSDRPLAGEMDMPGKHLAGNWAPVMSLPRQSIRL